MGGVGGSRILVVEDDEVLAKKVLEPLVATFGEAILSFGANDAMARIDAESRRIVAILADVCLPDGNGVQVVAHARSRWPEMPALLMTGYNQDDVVNAAFDLRADFVCKPIERSRLRRFLLDARSAAHQAALPVRIRKVVDDWRREYSLSEAEADLLERGSLGESSEQIAASRGVSLETIKKQRASLLRKTGVPSFDAARERVRHGAALVA